MLKKYKFPPAGETWERVFRKVRATPPEKMNYTIFNGIEDFFAEAGFLTEKQAKVIWFFHIHSMIEQTTGAIEFGNEYFDLGVDGFQPGDVEFLEGES